MADEDLKRSSRQPRRIAPKDAKSPGYSADQVPPCTLTIRHKAGGALAAPDGPAPLPSPFPYLVLYAISRFARLTFELPSRHQRAPSAGRGVGQVST
jgi:hypothetical protein